MTRFHTALLLIGSTVLLQSGLYIPPLRHPTATPQQQEQDHADCTRVAEQTPPLARAHHQAHIRQTYLRCMVQKGWTL